MIDSESHTRNPDRVQRFRRRKSYSIPSSYSARAESDDFSRQLAEMPLFLIVIGGHLQEPVQGLREILDIGCHGSIFRDIGKEVLHLFRHIDASTQSLNIGWVQRRD